MKANAMLYTWLNEILYNDMAVLDDDKAQNWWNFRKRIGSWKVTPLEVSKTQISKYPHVQLGNFYFSVILS